MGKPKVKVYDYLLSMQVGLAHGPIDAVNRIRVKDKAIFVGNIDRRTNICVDMPDLYGGDDKEGGPQGVVEVYMGEDDQLVSPEMAARFGRTPETCPGFRGLAQLFFRGRGGQRGFKWTTNNYYLPDFDVSLTDIPWALDEVAETDLAVIWPLECVDPDEDPDAPPEETTQIMGAGRQTAIATPETNHQAIYLPYGGTTLFTGSLFRQHRIALPEDTTSFCDTGAELDGYLQFLYPDGNTETMATLPSYADVDAGRVRVFAEQQIEIRPRGSLTLDINSGRVGVQLSFYAESKLAVYTLPVGVALDPETNDVAATSANGTSWFAVEWTSATTFADVTWMSAHKKFAAISPSGKIFTSPEGSIWDDDDIPANNWAAIEYAASGVTVAVAKTGTNRALRSVNGSVWTAHAMPGDHTWSAVCYSETLGIFVAVSDDGYVATSPDGATWTVQTCPVAAWKSVCWSPELGLFAAVGQEAGNLGVMTSPDGVEWTAQDATINADWRAIAWNPVAGVFVASGFQLDPDVADGAILSEDGLFWEPISIISAQGVTDIVWSSINNRMIAAGPDGVFTSANGRTWTRAVQGKNTAAGRKLAVATDMEIGVIGNSVGTNSNVHGPSSAQVSGRDSVKVSVETIAPKNARFVRIWFNDVLAFPLFCYSWQEDANARISWVPGSGAASVTTVTTDSLGTQPNANPAHIIYELMTNPEWGKGEDPSLINIPSHVAAAQTLFDEGFGMSFAWMKSSDVEAAIQDVIDHIKAVYYQDPATAQWTIKLLRGDYDPNTLKTINPDNAIIENGLRRSWGELVNEIVVTYTDPDTEEEATVTSHNNATYVTEGGYVSEGRNYHAIRDVCLAQRVADRDVIEAGYPLWSGKVYLLRDEWDIRPGAVYKLDWPEDDISGMIVRVFDVDYGKPGARMIKATLTEDIFGVIGLDTTTGQPPLWSDPWDSAPSALTDAIAITPPLPEVLRAGATEQEVEDALPGSTAMLLGAHDTAHVIDYTGHVQQTQPNGDSLWTEAVTTTPPGSAITIYPWVNEAESLVPRELIDRLGGGSLVPGARLLLTRTSYARPVSNLNTHDQNAEIVMLRSFDRGTQEWTVDRGIYDTVPREWPVGTRVWVLPGSDAVDPTVHGPVEPPVAVNYKVTPRMTRGQLPPHSVPDTPFYAIRREDRPFRPANCQIDGNGFGPTIYDTEPYPTHVTVTWENRNRWTEDAVIPRWTDPSAVPEDGQTVTLRIVDNPDAENPVVINEVTGLSGTSYSLPVTLLGALSGGWVQFIAVRDGLESLQFASRYVYVGSVGWDFTWSGKWGL